MSSSPSIPGLPPNSPKQTLEEFVKLYKLDVDLSKDRSLKDIYEDTSREYYQKKTQKIQKTKQRENRQIERPTLHFTLQR
eukprot:TRINITY_DN136810_c0_g1_i1.p1 TRINITY_DN136810_c0_g1~~TRINITY_DN136810_c0_g1_i1.p1  ORF type:complete len:80 (+),score=18.66 TRINITY_DN136810_c0_g1_i1:49-288(+)